MRLSRTRTAALLSGAALLLTACGGGDDSTASSSGSSSAPAAGSKGELTIGAANFSESTLLAQMYAQVLEKEGYKVTVRSLGNRELIEPALEKGELDVVPEYVGTLTEFLNKKANGPSAAPKASADLTATTSALRELAGKQGITILEPSEAADQNAFAVTADFAQQNNLTKLSDLAAYSGPLVLGGPAECPTRPFCQPGLTSTYGLKITGFRALDAGGPLTKKALSDGSIQLGLIFSSDGGIEANKLKVLEDDKGLQTVDNIVPAVNTAEANKPEIVAALNKVSAALDTDKLITLNKKIDVDRGNPEKVAEDFLKDAKLI